ncbi:hypothetical protein L3X38_036643 [Prunus dulcis]|uniref:Uncharacterized protein n=1 Tax=Prunus dulcis TaxID=3755 RepID=A0AAD4V3Q2_PRUDU|nr:hypothetical protein L3X38_036643 [Prunus dulcis]
MRKRAPLLTFEESILVDKLQKILHKHSPPTHHLGSAGEKVDPQKSTRKSVSINQIVKVANVADQQDSQLASICFLKEVSRTRPESLKGDPDTRQLPRGNHPTRYAEHAQSPSRRTLALINL